MTLHLEIRRIEETERYWRSLLEQRCLQSHRGDCGDWSVEALRIVNRQSMDDLRPCASAQGLVARSAPNPLVSMPIVERRARRLQLLEWVLRLEIHREHEEELVMATELFLDGLLCLTDPNPHRTPELKRLELPSAIQSPGSIVSFPLARQDDARVLSSENTYVDRRKHNASRSYLMNLSNAAAHPWNNSAGRADAMPSTVWSAQPLPRQVVAASSAQQSRSVSCVSDISHSETVFVACIGSDVSHKLEVFPLKHTTTNHLLHAGCPAHVLHQRDRIVMVDGELIHTIDQLLVWEEEICNSQAEHSLILLRKDSHHPRGAVKICLPIGGPRAFAR